MEHTSVIVCEEVTPGTTAKLNPALTQKVVHLVRHGQATHNVFAASIRQKEGSNNESVYAQTNESHTDAKLTQRGRLQASAAGAKILQTKPLPQYGFVSPLSRTLQTASIALARAGSLKIPLVADERIRERNGVLFCDKRSPKEDVMHLYPNVDFGNIAPGEDNLFSMIRETEDELASRGKQFFLSLKDRPETCFAVFTHRSFLYNTILRAIEKPDPKVGRPFDTGECRVVILTYR